MRQEWTIFRHEPFGCSSRLYKHYVQCATRLQFTPLAAQQGTTLSQQSRQKDDGLLSRAALPKCGVKTPSPRTSMPLSLLLLHSIYACSGSRECTRQLPIDSVKQKAATTRAHAMQELNANGQHIPMHQFVSRHVELM